jgi:hypothetical protein
MNPLVIGAWVSLHNGCDISSDIGGRDAALLILRSHGQQPFELHCQAEPLRQLVEVGRQALAEMDAITVEEGTEQASRGQAATGQSAGVRP